MATVQITKTIDTPFSQDEARRRLVEHLNVVKAKVVEGPEGGIEATRGSRLAIRILGAYLMPKDWMPTKATVGFESAGPGCRVTVTIADNFGLGIRTGMKGRDQDLLDSLPEGIASVLH